MNEAIERVPRTEQEAAASYTRLSKWYDRFGGSEWPHIVAGLRLLNVQPGECVLEVGCGTGRGLVTLAQAAGATGLAVGIDLSPGMLDMAREQVRKTADFGPEHGVSFRAQRGISPNGEGTPHCVRGDTVLFTLGSAVHLPYATAFFDAVFSSFMLDLIDTPDIPIVLSEMQRVLKPGGRVGLVSMSKACGANAIVKVYERFHHWLPKLIDCRPIYLQSAVESAGLHCEVHQTKSMWGLPVEIVIANRVAAKQTGSLP